MQEIKVLFKPCVENPPPPPEYKTSGAVGMDICSAENIVLAGSGGRATVRTGYEIELPEGFEGQVRSRSGLAAKNGIAVLNAPGSIDTDYRGEIKVILVNHSNAPFEIKKGDRIAQLVIAPVTRVTVLVVQDDLSETERGSGGFGSTGV